MRHHNFLLLIAVIMLAVFPLWLVNPPAPDAHGKVAELFTGADDKARNLVGEIEPNYQPWFKPMLEPASSEIASLLFALQAALGAGFIGYYLGASLAREKSGEKSITPRYHPIPPATARDVCRGQGG